MRKEVVWMVRYGVNDSHLTEGTGVIHKTRKSALKEFNDLIITRNNFKSFEVLRLEFHGKYEGASSIDVIKKHSSL